MTHGDYERLTPQAIDQVWPRLHPSVSARCARSWALRGEVREVEVHSCETLGALVPVRVPWWALSSPDPATVPLPISASAPHWCLLTRCPPAPPRQWSETAIGLSAA